MEHEPNDADPFDLNFCQAPAGACYTPERDGPLDEFLERQERHTFPLFKGLEHFELLRDKGWLAPRISIIRLMWNVGRGDGHFQVTEDFKLEGIENPAHGGEPGIHEPAVLFRNSPPFEAHHLDGPAFEAMLERQMEKAREQYRKTFPNDLEE